MAAGSGRSSANERTGDILIEDVILIDDIVDDLLGELVDHEDFPLSEQHRLVAVGKGGIGGFRECGSLRRPLLSSSRFRG